MNLLRQINLTLSLTALGMMLVCSVSGESLCLDHHGVGDDSAPIETVAHSCACHVPAHHSSPETKIPGPVIAVSVLEPVDPAASGYFDRIQRPPEASFPA